MPSAPSIHSPDYWRAVQDGRISWAQAEADTVAAQAARQRALPGLDAGPALRPGWTRHNAERRGFRKRSSQHRGAFAIRDRLTGRRRPGRPSVFDHREIAYWDSVSERLVPRELRHGLVLSPGFTRALAALVVVGAGRPRFEAYVAQLANIARVSRSTWHRAMRVFEAAGLIERHERPRRGDRHEASTFVVLDVRLILPRCPKREGVIDEAPLREPSHKTSERLTALSAGELDAHAARPWAPSARAAQPPNAR